MASVPKYSYLIQYNGKNVTGDLAPMLLSLNYTDRVEGSADEVELRLDDTDGRFRNAWLPERGDSLVITLGNAGVSVNCGTFEVDEVEYEGPPNTLTIRAIAAGAGKAVRTKTSSAHEKKTLRQIAQAIADKHGFSLQGTIGNVAIKRSTQHRQTDLQYLSRLAAEYGYVFSLRDKTITFHSVYDLEAAQPAGTLTPADLIRYAIRIKTVGTYAGAKVAARNPTAKKAVQYEYKADTFQNASGVSFATAAPGDEHVVVARAETTAQADQKAKAALHRENGKEFTGSAQMAGAPWMVAGNNFALHGLGEFSGLYHITESRHNVTRSGYFTDIEFKRVGAVADSDKRLPQQPDPGVKTEVIKI